MRLGFVSPPRRFAGEGEQADAHFFSARTDLGSRAPQRPQSTSARKSLFNRMKIGCVSVSPRRQLNSTTRGASCASIMRLAYRKPQYGVPSGSGFRPFIGDYDGIISLPGSAGLTWTGPGKTYGTLPINLEVYFGRVIP